MVYHGPVLLFMVEEKKGLPWSCPLVHGYIDKRFSMVLASGSWLKRGMVYHGHVLWFMVEERNGLPWSCLLVHG